MSTGKRKSVSGGRAAAKKAKTDDEVKSIEEQRAAARAWADRELNQGSPSPKKAPVAATAAAATATTSKRARSPSRRQTRSRASISSAASAVIEPTVAVPEPQEPPASPVPAPTVMKVRNTTARKGTRTKAHAKTEPEPAPKMESVAENNSDAEPFVESKDEATRAPAVATIPSGSQNEVTADNDDSLVNLWQHYLNAMGCCVRTILPVFVAAVGLFYGASSFSNDGGDDVYARAAVIVSLVYSAVLTFCLFVLLPLIIITRAVDKALFAGGAAILTSSSVEVSFLAFFVVASLLMSSYTPKNQ